MDEWEKNRIIERKEIGVLLNWFLPNIPLFHHSIIPVLFNQYSMF